MDYLSRPVHWRSRAWRNGEKRTNTGTTRSQEQHPGLCVRASSCESLGIHSGKAMAPHSSALAWRIPGTGEPGGLPSMGSHRVRHDWSNLAAAAAALPWIWWWCYPRPWVGGKAVITVGISFTEIHNWVLLYGVTLRVASWFSNLQATMYICYMSSIASNSKFF